MILKKTHKLILFLLAVYFCLSHVTTRLEMSNLQARSVQMEELLLQQSRQQQQILANQQKSMAEGARPWHPDTDGIPDLV